MKQPAFHENISHSDEVKIGSERSFGIVFTIVFLIIGLLPLWPGEPVRLWALIVAAVILALSLVAPKSLRPLNQLWFRFGQLLHKMTSPLIMGLIFFGCVMPIGLLMRILGKRPLDLEFSSTADSYWIHRTPPSPEPGSMKRQF